MSVRNFGILVQMTRKFNALRGEMRLAFGHFAISLMDLSLGKELISSESPVKGHFLDVWGHLYVSELYKKLPPGSIMTRCHFYGVDG